MVEITDRVIATCGQIRVIETEYQGKRLIDIRKWYRDGADTLKPTKKGLSIRREEFGDLVQVLQDALTALDGEEGTGL